MDNKKEKKQEKEQEVKGTVTIEEKKKTNIGKWIAVIIAIIIFIAVIVGIVLFMKTPYYAVMKTFNSLKKGNINDNNSYVSYENLMDSLVKGVKTGDEMTELEKNCFSEFKYKINSVKVEGDQAIVTVEATNKNFRNAMTKCNQAIFQQFVSGSDITNEQGITLLNKYLTDKDIGTMSVTKDLTLNKVDDKWQIVVDNNLIDTVFPGRNEVVNPLDDLVTEEL